MAKRFTDNEKWQKRFFRDLPMEYKLLWIYILDDCNHAGIWDVDLEVAGIRIGDKHFDLESVAATFYEQIVVFKDGDNFTSNELVHVDSNWTIAELKPSTSSQANNIKSFALRFSCDGAVPSGFEINDISIVYRVKGIK